MDDTSNRIHSLFHRVYLPVKFQLFTDITIHATKNGPAYEPQTVDDVARRAAQAEAIRKLQDEPDQFAEEAVQAKQESEKEKKARQERGEDKAASESDLPITIYGDHVLYHSDTGEFTASGNVRLYQGTQRLYTTEARGNALKSHCTAAEFPADNRYVPLPFPAL